MAIFCDFHDIDNEILGQIIQGCTSSRVCRKAPKDSLTLKQVLDEARSLELSESRAAIIENTAAANVSNNASAYTMNSGYCGRHGQHYRSHGSSNYDGCHFNNESHCNTSVLMEPTAHGPSHRGNNHRGGDSSHRRGHPNRVSNEQTGYFIIVVLSLIPGMIVQLKARRAQTVVK